MGEGRGEAVQKAINEAGDALIARIGELAPNAEAGDLEALAQAFGTLLSVRPEKGTWPE